MLTSFIRGIVDLIYPPFCKLCDNRLQPGECVVCENCLSTLQLFQKTNSTSIETQYLTSVHGTFIFDITAQQIIHFLKYSGNYNLGVKLGQITAEANKGFLKEFISEDCVLVPVPLHTIKKRTRGYNQAEAVARGISLQSGLKCEPKLLDRVINTASQTKLNKTERQNNVIGAFSIDSNVVKPKTVILIDDVFTTGATIDSAAEVLVKKGVSEVHALTVARPVQESKGLA